MDMEHSPPAGGVAPGISLHNGGAVPHGYMMMERSAEPPPPPPPPPPRPAAAGPLDTAAHCCRAHAFCAPGPARPGCESGAARRAGPPPLCESAALRTHRLMTTCEAALQRRRRPRRLESPPARLSSGTRRRRPAAGWPSNVGTAQAAMDRGWVPTGRPGLLQPASWPTRFRNMRQKRVEN